MKKSKREKFSSAFVYEYWKVSFTIRLVLFTGNTIYVLLSHFVTCKLLFVFIEMCRHKDEFVAYKTFCVIWYHLYNLKNVKKTHGRSVIFCKLTGLSLRSLTWFTICFKCRWKFDLVSRNILRCFRKGVLLAWFLSKSTLLCLNWFFNKKEKRF